MFCNEGTKLFDPIFICKAYKCDMHLDILSGWEKTRVNASCKCTQIALRLDLSQVKMQSTQYEQNLSSKFKSNQTMPFPAGLSKHDKNNK